MPVIFEREFFWDVKDYSYDHRSSVTQMFIFITFVCDLFPQIAWVITEDISLEFQIDRSINTAAMCESVKKRIFHVGI
jgi:hypothetical protein